MRQTPQEQPESMEFPRREFESVCFHAIGLVDQNREYLQMHLRESGDAPTRQALADMELQTARLERTLSEMMDLMALEEDPVPFRRGFAPDRILRAGHLPGFGQSGRSRADGLPSALQCAAGFCPGRKDRSASVPGRGRLAADGHGPWLRPARPGQLAGEPPPFPGRCGRWPEDLPGGLPSRGLGLCAGSWLRRRCRGGCDPPRGAGNSSFRRYHRPARGRGGAALPAALAAGTGAASAGGECLKAGFSECWRIS